MKKYINTTLAVLALLLFSCGHNVDRIDYQNYTPPTLKYKPRLLYPKSAQENAYAGNPKVIILISKTGTVDKVELAKSSGFDVLDDAALAFCKDLQFNPAFRNGKPVNSKMEWQIKFNFYEQPWDANKYVKDVETLYKRYENASTSDKNETLRNILEKHNEFVTNMKDGLNFNFYIDKVISKKLSDEWRRDWNAWPLSFLLYHDFIQRFQDYDSLANVKTQLNNSLRIDIQYISNMPANNEKAQEDKDYILFRINQFIKDRYPDLHLNTSALNDKLESKTVS